MKVSVEMDLTPQEARQLIGLPDLEPMQAAVMEKVQSKMEATIEDMNDPQALMENFFPVGLQAMEKFQSLFASLTKSKG
jgi:hypothetical protein